MKLLTEKQSVEKEFIAKKRTSRQRKPVDIAELRSFLAVPTPEEWLASAIEQLDVLLVDHANCEKKAASTALSMLYRYVDRPVLLDKLSRLAREELKHFEQVLVVMRERGVEYIQLSASRYAAAMMQDVRKEEPSRLIDTLIVGAFIEARSCERFAALVPLLDKIDPELADFYHSLLKSEARHYKDYLDLAKIYHSQADFAGAVLSSGNSSGESPSTQGFQQRINHFRALEAHLVQDTDNEFRFHSGPILSG